jgi:hypothetical protein
MSELDPYLSYSFRPLRIGFCCERPSAAEVLEMSALNCTLWGGSYNPIIDVSNGEEARRIVREYACDILYAFHPSKTVLQFIATFPELGWHDFDQLYRKDEDAYPVFADLLMCAANFTASPDAVGWRRVPPNDPAFPYLALTYGTLPVPSDRLPIDYPELLERHRNPPVDRLEDSQSDWGSFVLTQWVRRGIVHLPVRRSLGVLVGDTTDPEVLRAFWNLRAADISAVLLDPAQPASVQPWVEKQIAHVASSTAQAVRSDFHVWSLSSTPDHEIVPESVSAMARNANVCITIATIDQALSTGMALPFSYTRGRRDRNALPRISTTASRPTATSRTFLEFIPEMPIRAWRNSHAGYCALEIRSSTHADQPRSVSFRLPHIPIANEKFARAVGANAS